MSSSIYKEALADAQKLKEVAETNAKNVILERITPTIKSMIEKELLGEACADMEEDVLISPDEREKEEKKKGEKEEYQNESEKGNDIQLTAESVQSLAQMSASKAERYGVRALRIADKIEKLHEAKINDSTYGEKLRQIKSEIENTFKGLQEDVENNIVPNKTSEIISGKLEELYEVANKLLIPVKVRLINESNKRITKKYGQFKLIAEEYGLTKEAKKIFGKECIKLTKETKALINSVAELQEVVENKAVENIKEKIKGLFKEIYEMANKFGSLNEEELKIVISGLDTDDPEGSALTAMVEPSEEDELEDDLGDDLGDEGLGDEGLGDDMEMDMDEIGMYESEDELDELLGRSYKASGGRGRTGRSRMARARVSPDEERKQRERGAEREEEDALDELLGKSYKASGGAGRTGRSGARKHLSPEEREAQEKRGASLAAKEKESMREEENKDEVLEISEAMLEQELLRLRKRRAAMNEAMKAMQHSPGGGPGALDNFGGAGRQLGGGVEGELFDDYDSSDLNELDPVGTGYPVNENEEALDELLGKSYKASGGKGRTGRSGARKHLSSEERAAQEKKGKELEAKEKAANESVVEELAETVKAYENVFTKLRSDNEKLEEELRRSNLSNAKLVYATKLMQNENLSEKQRLVVVEQLDQAQSVREVKKLFTALKETLEGKSGKGKLTEGTEGKKPILGGSSKATKPGSSLTEAETKEFTRWGELAGFLNG